LVVIEKKDLLVKEINDFQAETLGLVVSYHIEHGVVLGDKELANILSTKEDPVSSDRARMRLKALENKRYLKRRKTGKGHKINKKVFCSTPNSARFLFFFADQEKENGYIEEDCLIENILDQPKPLFSDEDKTRKAINVGVRCGYIEREYLVEKNLTTGTLLDNHMYYLSLILI
jgi:hypothetical protein